MKKQFTIFIIFILGLVPIDFSNAITQNQIDAEVQIICPDSYGNWYSGSGTIIDSKGIILTNKHVTTDKYGSVIKTCAIGFIESADQEPNFYTNNEVNLAEVKYYTISNDMDVAVLYLKNLASRVYPYINIWNSNSDTLKLGDKIEVIGFPKIGGSTITYTSGDFSGFGGISDGTQNYIKTTAQVEHGNSGGAAYNSSGQFIGIPTMVVAGGLSSLTYVLSVNSIKSWLQNILGNSYQQQVIQQEPIIQQELSQNISEDITPPKLDSGWYDTFYICYEGEGTCNQIGQDSQIIGASNKISLQTTDFILTLMDNAVSRVVKTRYSYSKNLSDLNEKNEIEYTLKDYLFLNNKVQKINGEWVRIEDKPVAFTNWIELSDYGIYYIGVRFIDANGNVSAKQIIKYIYEQTPNFAPQQEQNKNNEDDENTTSLKYDNSLSKRLRGYILLQVGSRGEAYYINPSDSKRYYLGMPTDAFEVMKRLGLGVNHKFIISYKIYPTNVVGKILLDVEDQGKAYYIYPKDKKAYYLGKPVDAFKIMRKLGLGVTNSNLIKIPEGSLGGVLQNDSSKQESTENPKQDSMGKDEKKFKERAIDLTVTDLGENPDYIFYNNFDSSNISLFGIRIGDSKDKVPSSRDSVEWSDDKYGWTTLKNGAGYRTDNEKVIEMAIHEKIFGKLGISGREEAEFRFGKPDKRENSYINSFDDYYHAKGLIIRWIGDRITIINIVKK